MTLSVSIVSHSHGAMVVSLVQSLLEFEQVDEILVTLNVPESFPEIGDSRVRVFKNSCAKGFGANHNAAFKASSGDFFCVLNPDIVLSTNPFPLLIDVLDKAVIGVVAPIVVDGKGVPEDSVRDFLTPLSLIKRILGITCRHHSTRRRIATNNPDWVAGMFMLFRSEAYSQVSGFDERYFMYCEDADICTRLWNQSLGVSLCPSVSVIHNAQRASRRNLKHLIWHITSMSRYFVTHSWRLPKCG